MRANNGKKQAPSVNIIGDKGSPDGTILHIGRNLKGYGKNVVHLTYDAQGRFGIGTTKPEEKFHLKVRTRFDENVYTNKSLCLNGVCITGNDMKKLAGALSKLSKKVDDLNNKMNIAGKYFVKHGDQVTIKSTAHGGKRLQNANGPAKFDNHNRLGWERMIVEKCGLPGIGDKKNCG